MSRETATNTPASELNEKAIEDGHALLEMCGRYFPNPLPTMVTNHLVNWFLEYGDAMLECGHRALTAQEATR